MQIPVLAVSMLMILHGFLGPTIAPKNLATVLSWVHFRGILIFALLCAGNFFCMACPFMLVRNAARKLFRPRLNWPIFLRNKWLSVALFLGILFCYELFGLWSSPWLTACVIVGYFALALGVDGLFKHATFCKYVCPIGQFNFIASTLSPLEVKVREPAVCVTCATKDCIKGTRAPQNDLVIIQRGCELALFQPAKVGNMDCTFCLDCVHACPHDNVGILARMPAEELSYEGTRSGIGVFSRRKDLSALGVVFTFGALMNAFGMVSPIYTLEAWLQTLLNIHQDAALLGIVFALVILVEPLILLGSASWLTARTITNRKFLATLMRYSYSIVPMGFGMWLAHYAFHFLTGILTIVPATQSALIEIGLLHTRPYWTWTGVPSRFVHPLEFGFLLLGFAASMLVAWTLASEDAPTHPVRPFVPWVVVALILFVSSVWLMSLPMDMRATMMSG